MKVRQIFADEATVLVWKNDGNHIGVQAQIWSQRLSADGLKLAGPRRSLGSSQPDVREVAFSAPAREIKLATVADSPCRSTRVKSIGWLGAGRVLAGLGCGRPARSCPT